MPWRRRSPRRCPPPAPRARASLGHLKLWRDQSTKPSQGLSECTFRRVTSFWSLFFFFSPHPLPSDNSFWDVIRTTTTKQPKTTRPPPRHNPGELPAQAEASGRAATAVLPLTPVFPASSLFIHETRRKKTQTQIKPHGRWGISAFPCVSLGVHFAFPHLS